MFDILSESFVDVAKTVPLLLLVYALLYYIENRLTSTPALLTRAARFGPIAGAAAGTIPQCGFSAAAAALFSHGCLAPATLVSVFLATSDEAVPVLLAGGAGAAVAPLLAVKFALAVAGGYLLRLTVFRAHRPADKAPSKPTVNDCGCCGGSPVASVLWRTAKTAFFLFAVLLALSLVIEWAGEDRVSALLLADSVFQPLLCAVLGLVPSCAMSVLLSELYAAGTLSFGALIAGLSTGAGFGYLVLLEGKEGRHRALPIIAATFVIAVAGGTVIHIFFG